MCHPFKIIDPRCHHPPFPNIATPTCYLQQTAPNKLLQTNCSDGRGAILLRPHHQFPQHTPKKQQFKASNQQTRSRLRRPLVVTRSAKAIGDGFCDKLHASKRVTWKARVSAAWNKNRCVFEPWRGSQQAIIQRSCPILHSSSHTHYHAYCHKKNGTRRHSRLAHSAHLCFCLRQPTFFSPQATHQSVCLLSLAVTAKHVHDLVLIQVDHVFTSLATVLAWVEILRMQSKCLAHTGSECQT